MVNQPLTKSNRQALDTLLSIHAVAEALGDAPEVLTTYDTDFAFWKPGEGRPLVAPDTPAVAQAIGRCLAYRMRYDGNVGGLVSTELHPADCGWCDYPAEELRKANDYARWRSKFVRIEVAIWHFSDGQAYVRDTGRSGQYDNPTWAQFFSHGDTPSDRRFFAANRREAILTAASSADRAR